MTTTWAETAMPRPSRRRKPFLLVAVSLLALWGYRAVGEKRGLLPVQVEQTVVSPGGVYRATLADGATGAWDEVYLERTGRSLAAFNLSRQRVDGDSDIASVAWLGPRVLAIRYRNARGENKPDGHWQDVCIVHQAS